jgi:hypothetical protein
MKELFCIVQSYQEGGSTLQTLIRENYLEKLQLSTIGGNSTQSYQRNLFRKLPLRELHPKGFQENNLFV